MGGFAFIVRLVVAAVVFLLLVVQWAIVPFRDPEVELNLTASTVFFGNNVPLSPVRELLLMARGFFGFGITCFVLIPAFKLYTEANIDGYNYDVAMINAGLCVASYLGALVMHLTHL